MQDRKSKKLNAEKRGMQQGKSENFIKVLGIPVRRQEVSDRRAPFNELIFLQKKYVSIFSICFCGHLLALCDFYVRLYGL